MVINKLKTEHTNTVAQFKAENLKVVSLSKEIERLTNENNELHNDIIHYSENEKNIELKYNHSNLSYKSEIEDLKFIIANKDSKIKELEIKVGSIASKKKGGYEDDYDE